MKKIVLFLGFLTVSMIVFTSCKNDLQVFSPGKELVSVYGIINPNEPVQNIRINKVFLTDDDANVAAQDSKAINYEAGELKVTLERYSTGGTTKLPTTVGSSKTEIVLTETVLTTPSGVFNTNQRIYQTTDKLFRTGEYKLVIKKSNDLNTVIASAQTLVIDSVSTSSSGGMPFFYLPTNPSAFPMHGSGLYPTNPISTDKPKYVNYDVFTVNQHVKYKPLLNAKTYDLVIRFHYIDSLIVGGVDTTNYVDFDFTSQQSTKLDGSENVTSFQFITNDFYTNLGREMSKRNNPNVRNRKSYYLEYIMSAGTENLYTFLEVNAPSTTIAQDKPYYSNITNGVGIFACRSKSIVTKDLWSEFVNKVACHPSTFPYLFCDFSGKPC